METWKYKENKVGGMLVVTGVKLVNLTPHVVRISYEADPYGNANTQFDEMEIPPESKPARISTVPGKLIGYLGVNPGPRIPIRAASEFGEIEGLPEPVEGTIYIVSLPVAKAVGNTRDDVYRPGTGPGEYAIRNDEGQIWAVTQLIRSH